MPKRKPSPEEAIHQAVEKIAGLVDAFCREHLNEEYAELCRRLTEKLARKRPSPVLHPNSNEVGNFVAKNDGRLGQLWLSVLRSDR